MDDSIPFAPTKPLFVPVPSRECFLDGYIDDAMCACLDGGDNIERMQNAIALTVHALFRPTGGEILPRNDAFSKKKLQGEGVPAEEKIVLG